MNSGTHFEIQPQLLSTTPDYVFQTSLVKLRVHHAFKILWISLAWFFAWCESSTSSTRWKAVEQHGLRFVFVSSAKRTPPHQQVVLLQQLLYNHAHCPPPLARFVPPGNWTVMSPNNDIDGVITSADLRCGVISLTLIMGMTLRKICVPDIFYKSLCTYTVYVYCTIGLHDHTLHWDQNCPAESEMAKVVS